ncbi:hypothetical protein KL86DES1_20618 [uncultured Desulfovibrio sp.]|uniref:Uncharacterized protein n=1 Tax=uncultured Desulfovibrio sp. TaxID=167968 RepID=A0A212L4D8_9BACT|nr:hypothetical protein KL86DES1_20618 [uncultured Desulfovibrio sp.]
MYAFTPFDEAAKNGDCNFAENAALRPPSGRSLSCRFQNV